MNIMDLDKLLSVMEQVEDITKDDIDETPYNVVTQKVNKPYGMPGYDECDIDEDDSMMEGDVHKTVAILESAKWQNPVVNVKTADDFVNFKPIKHNEFVENSSMEPSDDDEVNEVANKIMKMSVKDADNIKNKSTKNENEVDDIIATKSTVNTKTNSIKDEDSKPMNMNQSVVKNSIKKSIEGTDEWKKGAVVFDEFLDSIKDDSNADLITEIKMKFSEIK